MSDASPRTHCIKSDAPARVAVNKTVFLDAFRDKGATTSEDRARLIETTRRNLDHYLAGRVEPKLTTARRIADALGRDINELWPIDGEAAA